MTDKELLELAAKAAGMDGMRWSGSGLSKMIDPSRPESTGSVGRDWSPLTDDGDALRLAVKLRIHMYFNNTYVDAGVKPNWGVPIEIGNDPYAATRRAIVRAAAEIGKAQS